MLLKVIQATTFKLKPVQSTELTDSEKVSSSANEIYNINSWKLEGDHIRFSLEASTFKGKNTWLAFAKHVQILEDGKVIYPENRPSSFKLSVPYLSQLDNYLNPTGSCNVTSVAMCLLFLGAKRKSSVGQFEDELYEYMKNSGLSRHSPHDLKKVIEHYRCSDDFQSSASLEDVQEWIREGNPVIIHGYFTSFGHIIVGTGYNATGLIVNDPYGEWTPNGYNRSASGKSLHYSYDLIRRTCMTGGEFWVHFVSK